MREDRVVAVKEERSVVRRGEAEVEAFPGEIRHLVSALLEASVLDYNGRGTDAIFVCSSPVLSIWVPATVPSDPVWPIMDMHPEQGKP